MTEKQFDRKLQQLNQQLAKAWETSQELAEELDEYPEWLSTKDVAIVGDMEELSDEINELNNTVRLFQGLD